MKARPLILLLVATGLFVWFETGDKAPQGMWAPAGGSSAPLADGGNTATSPDASAADSQAQWNAGPARLKREADGHFYARLTADGAPLRLMVDTGASVVALTGADAQAMGLRWTPQDVKPVARGANGMVNGVPVVIKRMDLDHLTVHNVQAVIVPEGLHLSLLGQSFLSRLSRMEVSGDTMQLGG